jgi:hypothetical protein
MLRERIVWLVALLVVAGAGFYSGQTIGVRTGERNRAQAAQQFFGQRGGQEGGQAGGQFGGGQAGQAGGQAGAGGGFARGNGGGVAGTVSAISGNTITINTRNGETAKIQLAADGTIRKQVDGQLSDITTGEQIVAFGAQSGDTFQATSIQVGGLPGAVRNNGPAQSP